MSDSKQTVQMVYGLDIGTRSVVGTVGYRKGKKFIVVAMAKKEHETRAMLDGQIHDIAKVAQTIKDVTQELEEKLSTKLSRVCIAAAGRVLKTETAHVDMKFDDIKVITEEDIYTLNSSAIEEAYKKFLSANDVDMKFYCVGSSIVRYYMHDSVMSNLENHKAKKIGVDIIATFLPDDVVDGLYKAVDLAGLEVASLTLEPIAAIGLAIPEKFRLLNIALVDVGAGTSDISITKDGSIIAFGMLPTAGDSLTESIATHCMVDFNTAEKIKKQSVIKAKISYKDVMGNKMTISKDEIAKVVADDVENMASQVAEKIIELNGGKTVGAVFVVGGGGIFPGYTECLADKLGVAKNRVALRGREVMDDIVFEDTSLKADSLLVTPIGIALSFYEETNNFIYVDFNGTRVKIYNNNNLTVMDVAMQTEFPGEGFFPKSGKPLIYTLDGVERMVRGSLGEPAVITVNGESANLNTHIKEHDIIEVKESTAGAEGTMKVSSLPGYKDTIRFNVNGIEVSMPKFVSVNGNLESEYYDICQGDDIKILDYYTVEQIMQFMDIDNKENAVCMVNNKKADDDTKVYENFTVEWKMADDLSFDELPEDDEPDSMEVKDEDNKESSDNEKPVAKKKAKKKKIVVNVNGKAVTLDSKSSYVFVDIFDKIDFDLSKPQGAIVTKKNGASAEYMEEIHDGDVIDVYWEKI
ncbi:MAG: rod shape-determining protein [Lachnospiraceae bacterium]|nr:rod shape-determining protein [Lachnospiraceae bacterium]